MKTPVKEKIYFENLDAIRFLCFLSVFFFHSFHTTNIDVLTSPAYLFITENLFSNENLGVNFFFVLSGFLITYLLIREKELNNQIDLKRFWLRRNLRIWPLFYFCVFFGFVIFPIIKTLFGQTSLETANILYYVSFLNNFDLVNNGLPESSVLGVLWSIAIEEQFYLVWPIILYICPIRKYWIPFTAILLVSLISRAQNINYLFFEFHTLSCIGDIVIGSFGAWLILQNQIFKDFIINLKKGSILFIYTLFLVVLFFRKPLLLEVDILNIFERMLIAISILLIILEQSFSKNSLFKFSTLKRPTRLEKISYGLYSLHFIAILITMQLFKLINIPNALFQTLIAETAIALFLTIVLSKISYMFLEKPFLRMKDKFSYFTK